MITKTKSYSSFQVALVSLFVIHCCQQHGTTTSLAFSESVAVSSNFRQECIDCAIVGGGPAGLATAIAISNASPSSSIAIFERDGFQPKGASIQISKSGWKSVAELDSSGGDESLKTKLEETAVPITTMEIKPWTKGEDEVVSTTRRGRLRNDVKNGLSKLKSYVLRMFSRILVSVVLRPRAHLWHDVRVVLYEYANKLYRGPNNTVDDNSDGSKSLVNPNLNLENIRPLSPSEYQDAARFELLFKNVETGEERKVRAKYIIACDGVNSKVRSILPNEPDILLSEGKSVWRGQSPNICTSGKATFYRSAGDSNTAGRSALIFPAGENAGSSWTLISDAEVQRSTSDEEARERVLKVIESMGKDSDNFKLWKEVVDDSAIIIENKLYVRDFEKPWESSYDGLIYIGDSAHPVRPTGEGTALAFEDANILGKVISKFGLGVEALRNYESERYEPVKLISEKIRKTAQNFYKVSTSQNREIYAPRFVLAPESSSALN